MRLIGALLYRHAAKKRWKWSMMLTNRLFYALKPVMPRTAQLYFRRMLIRHKVQSHRHVWPIDYAAGDTPKNWKGWPDGKQFAFVLSHDVDTQRGHDNVMKLAELEMNLGFRSSFNFVPERYNLSRQLIDDLWSMGFEVCVHGLNHDGKLFWSRKIFAERAVKINEYLKDWKSVGFTSPSMHHNLEWMHMLNIQHATSTFDTDPFEPEPDGFGTIFPYWVQNNHSHRGYVELPYTIPQDFTLFVLMEETDGVIWRKKLAWIAENDGMALLNTHPDYMNFNGDDKSPEIYPVRFYEDFLLHIKQEYKGRYWAAKPEDVALFCLKDVSRLNHYPFETISVHGEK